MKEQEKKIMMIDLCARLPYGVKGKVETTDGNGKEIKDDGVINSVFINEHGGVYICIEGAEYELEDVKPYLRPLSSMTEEEKKYLENNFRFYFDECSDGITNGIYYAIFNRTIYQMINEDDISDIIDWLNAHHFDYRGLIENGLALPAPNEMYNIK